MLSVQIYAPKFPVHEFCLSNPSQMGVFFGRIYGLYEVVEQSGSTQRGEKRKLSLVEPLS